MKSKDILILIGLLAGSNISGQSDNLTSLIMNSIHLYEPNPSYYDETRQLNETFTSLINGSEGDAKTIIPELFDHVNKNAATEFEDEEDIRRIKSRLCLCYSSMAILSDRYRFEYYADLAKYSLLDSDYKPEEFLVKQYCGVLMLKISLKVKYNLNFQKEINNLDSILDYYKKALTPDYYTEAKMIVKKYKTKQ
jgi:hypothetical protein